MAVREKPHFTVCAASLAEWIELQPDRWWVVDGDPLLTSLVDFPCPSDEIAPAIRKIGKNLLLQDKTPLSRANGEFIEGNQLDEFCDTRNRHQEKTLLLSWVDSDVDWLLVEDKAAVCL